MGKSGRASQRNQVRIISGVWRGRKLWFPSIDGLRPTPDRVRETLFNWLSPEIRGARCLDLFAGSGALGFEALSRGAPSCCFVDANKDVCSTLEQNAQTLDCQDRTTILHTDARAPLKHSTVFDIVFLDPPFHTDLLNLTLQWLLDSDSLHPNTLIYLETPKNVSIENFPLSIRKEKSASDVTSRLVSPC